MSKKLTFTVTVEFEDKIYDDGEVLEVAKNIAHAIEQEADRGIGIAPEASETFTRSVEVKPQFLEETVKKEIV
jgi:quercetin dioxygenase-like cupin family protein